MDPQIILDDITEYRRQTGLKVTTICQMAFRNAKYFDRLTARAARLKVEHERFKKFAEANPPSPAASAAPTQEHLHETTSE